MTKQELERAFGTPFTTKKKVRDAMGYSQYVSVSKFFYGLDCFGRRYLTSDVVKRVLEERKYGN